MKKANYTIGLAGHIDHGKTSLTKALTNIDTDRLKEEKERNISIELGFAPLKIDGVDMNISIIDVPGHERFIRQMIAGVAGIDLVLIVIAADEGIMPQTEEHIHILSYLKIEQAIIVLTKINKVDEELLELVHEDVKEFMQHTPFSNSPIVQVDSVEGVGMHELKRHIENSLKNAPNRNESAPFRMPIDQVFSINGVGTIARGTIYEGSVQKEDTLYILPSNQVTKARQVQVHSVDVGQAAAGQRAAIQLAGIAKQEVKRGEILVKSPENFTKTNIIDLSLQVAPNLTSAVKQRSPIKFHTGASEVYGTIVFFDRNKLEGKNEEIVCQVRLQDDIVVKRGDRFVLRRATPMETIGGGWIINPKGEKYKFGQATIDKLMKWKEGSPKEQITNTVSLNGWIKKQDLLKEFSLDLETLEKYLSELKKDSIIEIREYVTTKELYQQLVKRNIKQLQHYHAQFPMRKGMNKPEFLQVLPIPKQIHEDLLQHWIEEGYIKLEEQFVSIRSFQRKLPSQWEKKLLEIMNQMKIDGLKVQEWDQYVTGIPKEVQEDFKQYLLEEKKVYHYFDNYYIHQDTFETSVQHLKKSFPAQFELKDAKEKLDLSRKYLIPFLELLDKLQLTKRVENKRMWIK